MNRDASVKDVFTETLRLHLSKLPIRAGTGCHVCDETLCEMSQSKCPGCQYSDYMAAYTAQAESVLPLLTSSFLFHSSLAPVLTRFLCPTLSQQHKAKGLEDVL